MNNTANTPKWKKALKWLGLALVVAVILDWVLDGRLRSRLPGRRRSANRPDLNS